MSKRKKHNPAKRYALLARQLFKYKGLAFVAGEDPNRKCHVVDIRTGKQEPMTPVMAMALDAASFKWYVEMTITCRDQNGQEYAVNNAEIMGEYYKHDDPALMEYLNKMHQAELKKVNQLHRVTVAWIRVPVFTDFIDMDVMDKIYRDLGAYDFISTWEHEQQQKEECTA